MTPSSRASSRLRDPVFVYVFPLGRQALERHPERVDLSVLNHYPAYRALRARSAINGDEDGGAVDAPSADTPQEALDKAYLTARVETGAELLRRVVERPPAFVEVEDGVLPFGSGIRAQGQKTTPRFRAVFPSPSPGGFPHNIGSALDGG